MKIYAVAFRDWHLILDYDTKLFFSKAKAKSYLNSINEYGDYEIVELETEDKPRRKEKK